MLRYRDQIRLTLKEQQMFRALTGKTTVPTTVEEFNRCLHEAADHYEQAQTPEEKLLGELAREMLAPN